MIIVVSEETGTISFAYKGLLKRNLTPLEMRGMLNRGLPRATWFGLGQKKAEEPLAPAAGIDGPGLPSVAQEDPR